jgi:hypothetical protein
MAASCHRSLTKHRTGEFSLVSKTRRRRVGQFRVFFFPSEGSRSAKLEVFLYLAHWFQRVCDVELATRSSNHVLERRVECDFREREALLFVDGEDALVE